MAERLTGRAALLAFLDADSLVELDACLADGAGVVAGYGTVDGAAVYAFAQDSGVERGAVTAAGAAKMARLYALAAQSGAPVAALLDSDGVRLGDGIAAMRALSRVLTAAQAVSGVVPQVAVILGGAVGSAALLAAAADVVIRVEGADYHLTPDATGEADVTVPDAATALTVARDALSLLPANNLAGAPAREPREPRENYEQEGPLGLLDVGCHVELAGGMLGRMGGQVVGLVHLGCRDNVVYGAAHIARFVRLCDAFGIPVISLVQASRFETLRDAALVSQVYAEATTLKLAVALRADGAVYIAAVASADACLAVEEAVISPLPPAAAVRLLWQERLAAMTDPQRDFLALEAEYCHTLGSAAHAAQAGGVDDVVAWAELRERLLGLLDAFAGKRVKHLPRKHPNIVL